MHHLRNHTEHTRHSLYRPALRWLLGALLFWLLFLSIGVPLAAAQTGQSPDSAPANTTSAEVATVDQAATPATPARSIIAPALTTGVTQAMNGMHGTSGELIALAAAVGMAAVGTQLARGKATAAQTTGKPIGGQAPAPTPRLARPTPPLTLRSTRRTLSPANVVSDVGAVNALGEVVPPLQVKPGYQLASAAVAIPFVGGGLIGGGVAAGVLAAKVLIPVIIIGGVAYFGSRELIEYLERNRNAELAQIHRDLAAQRVQGNVNDLFRRNGAIQVSREQLRAGHQIIAQIDAQAAQNTHAAIQRIIDDAAQGIFHPPEALMDLLQQQRWLSDKINAYTPGDQQWLTMTQANEISRYVASQRQAWQQRYQQIYEQPIQHYLQQARQGRFADRVALNRFFNDAQLASDRSGLGFFTEQRRREVTQTINQFREDYARAAAYQQGIQQLLDAARRGANLPSRVEVNTYLNDAELHSNKLRAKGGVAFFTREQRVEVTQEINRLRDQIATDEDVPTGTPPFPAPQPAPPPAIPPFPTNPGADVPTGTPPFPDQEGPPQQIPPSPNGPVEGLGPNDGQLLPNDPPNISNILAMDDYTRWEVYAPQAYNAIRNQADDVSAIARNIGWSEENVQQVKNHLFYNKHQLDDRIDLFDPSPDIADAWERLRRGEAISEDIDLLKHELYEAWYEQTYKVDYRTAHDATNDAGYTWEPPPPVEKPTP